MKDTVKEYLDRKKRRASRRKKAAATLLSMSLVVAAGVTWSLHQTGESLTGETYCGKTEHTHTEACLKKDETKEKADTEKVLTCTLPEHTHTDACITKTLICGQEESAGHTHSVEAGCYQEQQVLTCTQEEHVHGEGCYDADGNLICTIPEHTHGEGCYTTEQVLVCTQPESEGHVHTDACYEITYNCGMEEHTHTDACYSTVEVTGAAAETASADSTKEPEYTCGLEEHKHTLQCYSNPNADLETAEVWEKTFANVTLTGDYGKDVVAIAKTQLGYHESTANYNVVKAADGTEKAKGWTRYGAWYGSPYEDWCAMFASFCINYAHVQISDNVAFPLEAYCPGWITTLSKQGRYVTRDAWTPAIGDLVFFDQNNDGTSDHVGIVESLTKDGTVLTEDADLTTANGIKTIEGNSSDQVAERDYGLTDNTIVGYGVLPVKEKVEETTETSSEETTETSEEKQTENNITNPEAGLETEETWQQSVAGVTLTGDARTDLVAIASTQIGYTESTENYKTGEDGTISGYNRYGAWYGDPYGDWNEMFASFCLKYANVDYPQQPDAAQWANTLSASGLYSTKDSWIPAAGDLVFIDQDGDGAADRVGIVSGLTEDGTEAAATETESDEADQSEETASVSEESVAETENAAGSAVTGIRTIEGDVSGAVAEQSYSLTDGTIVGYGLLTAPEENENKEEATLTKTATCEEYTVTVTYDKSAGIPDGADLVVSKIEAPVSEEEVAQAIAAANGQQTTENQTEKTQTDEAQAEAAPTAEAETEGAQTDEAQAEEDQADGTEAAEGLTSKINVSTLRWLDISFMMDGVEIEPAESSIVNVQITVSGESGLNASNGLSVLHRKNDGTIEKLENVESTGKLGEDTAVSFSTNTFSPYGIAEDEASVTLSDSFKVSIVDNIDGQSTEITNETDKSKMAGCYILKVTDGSATYYGADAADILLKNNYTVTWDEAGTALSNGYVVTTSSTDTSGNVTTTDVTAVETNGGWVHVGYLQGAQKKFTVTVIDINKRMVGTDDATVSYYDQLQNGSFDDVSMETLKGNSNEETWKESGYDTKGGVWKTTASGGVIEIVNPTSTKTQNVTDKGSGDSKADPWNGTYNSFRFNYSWFTSGNTDTVENPDLAATAADGNYFAELNADKTGALYQDVLTTPGEILNYSLYHRARGNYPGWVHGPNQVKVEYDTMYLVIAPYSVVVSNNLTTQKNLETFLSARGVSSVYNQYDEEGVEQVYNQDGILIVRVTSDDQDWHYMSNINNALASYVPTETVTRFFFVSGYCAADNTEPDHSAGNFLDKVEFSQSTPTAAKGSANVTVYKRVYGLPAAEAQALLRTASLITNNGDSSKTTMTLTSTTAKTDTSGTYYEGSYVVTVTGLTSGGGGQTVTFMEDKGKASNVQGYTLFQTKVGDTVAGDTATGFATVDYSNNSGTVVFTNIYQKAPDEPYIKVQKTFVGLTQDQVDDSLTNFKLTVTDSNNKSTDLTLSTGTKSTDANNNIVYTWKLDSESGTTYTVSETGADVADYTVKTEGIGSVTANSTLDIGSPKVVEKCSSTETYIGNNVNYLIVSLTNSGYFIWTEDPLSASARSAMINFINTDNSLKQVKTGDASSGNTYFYSADVLKATDGFSFRNGTIKFEKGNLTFTETKQWKKYAYGTYSEPNNPEVKVINTYTPEYVDVTIKKMNEDKDTVLTGAKFTLTRVNSENKTEYYTGNTNTPWSETETPLAVSTADATKGQLSFTNLPAGTYTLTETKAPDGYNLLSYSITIEVAEGKATFSKTNGNAYSQSDVTDNNGNGGKWTYTVTVPNSTGVELPMTGGAGTTLFTLSGLCLMAGAFVYGCGLRRRRERRSR